MIATTILFGANCKLGDLRLSGNLPDKRRQISLD